MPGKDKEGPDKVVVLKGPAGNLEASKSPVFIYLISFRRVISRKHSA